MSIAELNALYVAAIAALDAGDYDTAIRKAIAVKLRLATTPDSTQGSGAAATSLAWANAAAIDDFVANCRRLQVQAAAAASGGPFRQSAVTYARPAASGDQY